MKSRITFTVLTIALLLSVVTCEQPFDMPNTSPNGAIETPVFSPEGGIFNDDQEIEITCATTGVDIYYTTDNTVPTTDSTQYIGPLTVSEQDSPLTITARAFLTSMTPSSTVVHNYKVDATAPQIVQGIYGWATDSGWAISWPNPENDTLGIDFSITANGETVSKSYSPEDEYGFIAETDFTTPPYSYDAAAITDIRLTYRDSAGNSSVQGIAENTELPTFSPGSGYYLEAQEVELSASADALIYYTLDGSYPDMTKVLYATDIDLSGNTEVNTIRTSCFKQNEMTLDYPTSATVRIDTTWDDSFDFAATDTNITATWTDPFDATPGDQFTNITIDFEPVLIGTADISLRTYTPAADNEDVFNGTDGEAYNISVSAEDINTPTTTVPSSATARNYYYEDVYTREGIIFGAPDSPDECVLTSLELSVSGSGTGTPWTYTTGGETQLFAADGTITKMRRSSDGSLLYYLVDYAAANDQIWIHDLSAAVVDGTNPVQLSAAANDIIDFALVDGTAGGDIVYITADSAESIVTLTPASPLTNPATEVVEYTYDSTSFPSFGTLAAVEMFDADNIVLLSAAGELSAHAYPAAAGPSEALSPTALTGIDGVPGASAVLKDSAGMLYAAENVDGEHTDIYRLTSISPAAAEMVHSMDDTGLSFHDISAGGKNILFSDGEQLYVYNVTFNSVIDVLELAGTAGEGLTTAAW